MSGIDWNTVTQGTIELSVLVGAVGVLVTAFFTITRYQTKQLIGKTTIPLQSYLDDRKRDREERIKDRADIEALQRSTEELRAIKVEISSVQKAVTDLKQDQKEGFDNQRDEMNGALGRLENTMREYTKAVAGKS